MELVSEKDNILRTPTTFYEFYKEPLDPEYLTHKMFETMSLKKGIGLAAPQVGLSHSHFVMGDDTYKYSVFNPQILEVSKEQIFYKEGCLSFPGLFLKIKRPERIVVKYWDEKGKPVETRFEDIWARCFQHEYDHLMGICFDKRVSRVKLDMAKRKRSKHQEQI